MFRTLFWLAVWCLSFGTADIEAKYKDGLTVRLYNIWKKKDGSDE